MTLTEIGDRINKHLKRFEADPSINVRNSKYGTSPYYHASAVRAGRYVNVVYVAYQGSTSLSREDAESYLEWLDSGHVGTHYEALR